MKKLKIALFILIAVAVALGAFFLVRYLMQRPVTIDLSKGSAVIADNKRLCFRAEQIYTGEDGTLYLDLSAENKTDEELNFNLSYVTVNNWTVPVSIAFIDDLEPKEKSTFKISLCGEDIFKAAGITEASEVRFHLKAYTYSSYVLERDVIIPIGDSDSSSKTARTEAEGETVITNNDKFTCIIEKIDVSTNADGRSAVSFTLYMKNKTAKKAAVEFLCYAVNDLETSGWSDFNMYGKTECRYVLTLGSEDFGRFGMTEVDKIRVCLRANQADNSSRQLVPEKVQEHFTSGLTQDTMPKYERLEEENESSVIDNENIEFVIFEIRRQDSDSYRFSCYFENKTADSLSFAIDNPSVNGTAVSMNTSSYFVSPYFKQYLDIYFDADASDLSEVIEEFKFKLKICRRSSDIDYVDENYYVVDPDEVFEYVPSNE